MSMETDIAVSVIKLAIEGVTYSVKITGKAISNVGRLLSKFANSNNLDSPGAKSLKSLIKSGRALHVISIQREYLKTFTKEAKRYGIQYHVIKEKNSIDDSIDIIVDSANSHICDRIVKRYQLMAKNMERGDNKIAEVTKESQETKETEMSQDTNYEKDNQLEESEHGVSDHFLQEENPYENLLKNSEDFELKERMPLKEALDKLKVLWTKTRQRIMSDKIITTERKDNNLER